MSADLRDLRAKITVETDCALTATSRARGMDRSEIVREVLHVWAQQQIDAAMLLQKQLIAEGLLAARKGSGGNGA